MDRRIFLKSSGLALVAYGVLPRFLVRAAYAEGDAARPDPAATPFRAVSLTPTLPRSLQGKAPAVALADLRSFDLRKAAGPAVARGFEEMYAGAVDTVLHGAGRETFDALEFLKKTNPAKQATADGVDYPNGRYGLALRQIAQLLKSDVGVELAFAEISGWDTHAGEGG